MDPIQRQQRLDAGADDVDPAQLGRRPLEIGERKLRIAQHVVRRHQAVGGGEPIERLEVLAQRGAHALEAAARQRRGDRRRDHAEHVGLVGSGLEMDMQVGHRSRTIVGEGFWALGPASPALAMVRISPSRA